MRFLHQPTDAPCVKPVPDAKRAHDSLLAMAPDGAVHEPCGLCPETAQNKEVAQVADADRTYTEAEHLALMTDAVRRETAELADVKADLETSVSEKAAQVDVLEAEKAALETKVSEVQAEFDAFKAEIERAREVETAKQDRLSKVKAANEGLAESYFTEERIQRWAEMTEEAFTAFIEDISAVAVAGPAKETAAFGAGESPTDKTAQVTVGSIFAARRGEKN
jgi:hypothetical protein